MKLTKTQLRKVIKEEIQNTLQEFAQAGSQAQQAGAQRASLVKAINANVRDIEKMAVEIMNKSYEEAYYTKQPFGRMISGALDKRLEKEGFDDARLDAVYDYLKTYAKDKQLRYFFTNPGKEVN